MSITLKDIDRRYPGFTRLFALYAVVAIFIVLAPLCILGVTSIDTLNKCHAFTVKPLVTVRGTHLDCWSASHFVLYTIIGFMFPHLWGIVLTVSVLWEVFEFIGGRCERVITGRQVYWRGRWSDLLVNLVGFVLGAAIRLSCSRPLVNK